MSRPLARPRVVTAALALVALQILLAIVAGVLAVLATRDGKPFAVTVPGFLIVLYAIAAYYLFTGHQWARIVTIVVAALGIIGHLSVAIYYGDGATTTISALAGIVSAAVLVLLLLPASSRYYSERR